MQRKLRRSEKRVDPAAMMYMYQLYDVLCKADGMYLVTPSAVLLPSPSPPSRSSVSLHHFTHHLLKLSLTPPTD